MELQTKENKLAMAERSQKRLFEQDALARELEQPTQTTTKVPTSWARNKWKEA